MPNSFFIGSLVSLPDLRSVVESGVLTCHGKLLVGNEKPVLCLFLTKWLLTTCPDIVCSLASPCSQITATYLLISFQKALPLPDARNPHSSLSLSFQSRNRKSHIPKSLPQPNRNALKFFLASTSCPSRAQKLLESWINHWFLSLYPVLITAS